jgi:hypothetical protein
MECMWVTKACGTGSQRSEWGRTESDRALSRAEKQIKGSNDKKREFSSVICCC